MLGIVRRDENEFAEWLKKQQARAADMLEGWGMDPRDLLNTEIGWLLTLPKYEGNPIVLDMFQVGFLTNQKKQRSMVKARQIGFSFGIGCESVARCHLKEKHTAICVSYNLDDAKQKVETVKELHDELPLEFQKKMVIDKKTEVGFASLNSKRRISRVVSFPSRPPRGKSGDVYLDELAHCQNDKQIYAGATALIARSGGQLTIGSTPLGQRGIFHAVHTQAFDKYPGYERWRVPWWVVRTFSKIAGDRQAILFADTLPTEIRVARYGTQALIDQFNMLPIEDFQQEFELAFQDERVSFFDYSVILPCFQHDAHEIPVYDNLEQLAEVAGKLGPLRAGFDVGRSKHPSELYVFEKRGAEYVERFREQYRDWKFPKQRARLKQVIRTLRPDLTKFRIDQTGLGKNLAEDLQEEFGTRLVEGVDFSMQSKEALANSIKILMQERNLIMARDRATIAQIHSIKQRITAAGNSVFDTEKNRNHHADKFWAITLAVFEKRRIKKNYRPAVVDVRTVGATPTPAPTPEVLKNVATVAGAGVMEKLFTLPDEEPVAATATKVARVGKTYEDWTTEALADHGKELLTAARAWKQCGDLDRAREIAARYQRIRREVRRRRAISQLGLAS